MPEITTDQAVRELFRSFDTFDGARQARDLGPMYGMEEAELSAELLTDGRIARSDLEAVVALGEGGGYSQAQVDAARHLLDRQELLDGLDVAADAGGGTDDRIAGDDVVAFIDAHRAELEPETVAIADAAHILDVGARDGRDDYDARLVAFAEQLQDTAPEHRDILLREIVRQDGGAPESWLQRSRLEAIASDGDRLSAGAYAALSGVLPLAPAQLPDPPDGSFRAVTYNIGQGASRGEGKGTDFDELPDLAQNIHASRADIVAVQEIFEDDVEPLRQELQAVEDRAAQQEGREPRTVHITFSNADGSKEIRHEDGRHTVRGGGFGNAVITYAPQRPVYDERLPDDGDEGRSLLGVETEIDGQTVTVFTTHISSVGAPDSGSAADDRQTAQIQQVFDAVEQYGGDGPVLLTGDFNVTFGGSRPSAEVFGDAFNASGFTDAAADAGATSNLGFGRRIDYIFSDGFDAGQAYVVDAGTSDHAAVAVDLSLPD